MKNQKKSIIPNDFFSKSRPNVSNKETLKDVISVKWNEEVLKGNKKAIVDIVKK